MRENDRVRGAGFEWPPAGTPQSPHAHGGEFEGRAVPVILSTTVPADADPDVVGQVVADACSYLVRDSEGWYRAMAYVWTIPTRQPDPVNPGFALESLLVSVAARRPWFQEDGTTTEGELEAVVTDALGAIGAAITGRFPSVGADPAAVLPVDAPKAESIIRRAGGMDAALTTSDIHQSLYDGESEAEDEPEPDEGPTYRFVDRENRGWHIASSRDEPVQYAVDWAGLRPGRPEELLSHEQLEAMHGPLRPVVPSDPSDDFLLRDAIQEAGVKAAASVLVALYRTAVKFAENSSQGSRDGGSLTAGREGSWEAEAIERLAWSVGGDLDEKPGRFDAECVESVQTVLAAWTLNPDYYVEVAEGLAYEFSRVADELGGWAKVADRWLRHDGSVRGYLMSKSPARFASDDIVR
ncbi:hypothetical protein [Streptomyces sp. NPDC088707]|uniref:hypothetical protein n=1 Tax=Streptomyces sp. NPDC088707 TaxID=3365871 RepID=UPI00380F2AB4